MSVPPMVRMIKQATRDLVAQFDTQADAAHVLDVSQQHVSRMCDRNTATNVIGLSDMVRLEGAAEEPSLTKLLAKMAGGVFIRLPEDFGDASGLPMQVVALVKEVGDVADALREGLADDDRLDHAELAKIERELDELIDKAAQGRAQVRAMQGKAAAPVRVAAVGEP